MFYYLYEIKNLINNKIYVGVHKTSDLNDGYMGSGKIIRSAIEKHGLSNFSKVILETFENVKDMYAREKEVVNEEFLKRKDVYNLRRGGTGGFDYLNNGSEDHVKRCVMAAKILHLKHPNIILNLRKSTPESARKGVETKRKNGTLPDGKCLNTERANKNRKETFVRIGHQQGNKNSQSGTTWITNNLENKKIKKIDPIPVGFRKGRYRPVSLMVK
jgi:hypothetical protein